MRDAEPTRGSPPEEEEEEAPPAPAAGRPRSLLAMAMSDMDSVEDIVLPSRESGPSPASTAEPEEDAEAPPLLLSLAFDAGLCLCQ
jgi:hypothetical protein